MKKIKGRLDAFTDGIMAIIITIMVLNLTPVLTDSWPNYIALARAIGIYLISYIFVANMWCQHAAAFAEIDGVTYRILLGDIAFLALLSLVPLFTATMTQNTTRITVLLYGVLLIAVNSCFRLLTRGIVHLRYTKDADMRKVYAKIYGNANRWLDLLSVIALAVAAFVPKLALVFYLAYPVLMFIFSGDERSQFSDAAALPAAQQKALAALPANQYADWRRAQQEIRGGQPVTRANFLKWLNQNVDDDAREAVQAPLANITPEQQKRMAEWFEAHRKQAIKRAVPAKKPTVTAVPKATAQPEPSQTAAPTTSVMPAPAPEPSPTAIAPNQTAQATTAAVHQTPEPKPAASSAPNATAAPSRSDVETIAARRRRARDQLLAKAKNAFLEPADTANEDGDLFREIKPKQPTPPTPPAGPAPTNEPLPNSRMARRGKP